MKAHPIHDNFLLISADNTLRLFDVAAGHTLRTFNTREIPVGTRIEGKFSPNGTYLYASCLDKYALVHRTIGGVGAARGGAGGSSGAEAETTGLFLWRIDTGKVERHLDNYGMLPLGEGAAGGRLGDAGGEEEGEDAPMLAVERSAVSNAEWLACPSVGGGEAKCLIAASMDGLLRIHV